MSLKKQILEKFTEKKGFDFSIYNSENPVHRYLYSMFLLLKKENASRIDEFINLYVSVLKNTELKLLNIHHLILLYRKWLKYPLIFEDIKLTLRRLGSDVSDENFLALIIEHSVLDKPARNLHLARLNLLIYGVKEGMIKPHEFLLNGIVIKTLLKLSIHPNDQQLINKGFTKDSSNHYRCMFFVVRQLINLKVDKLTLVEIINIHFSKPEKPITWTENSKKFFQILESRLPADYLINLNQLDLRKIHFLYVHQPFLFEHFKFNLTLESNLKNIVDELFQNFMISRVFLHNYIKNFISELEKEWFVMELEGKSLRYDKQLPFKLTQKAAHFFRCMPEDIGLTVTRSLIYAQLFVLTSNHAFSLAVATCIRNISESEYWIESMTILYKKGLVSGDVNEIMDYINEVVFVRRTKIDIKNKSLGNLKRDIEQWHQQLNTIKLMKSVSNRKLPDASIPDFLVLNNDLVYSIKQIKRVDELYFEGKNLSHCVYSYKKYCIGKTSYIFSLRCYYLNTPESSLITIELNRYNKIVQARGKFNRSVTEEELSIIQMWADENNLLIAI